MNSNDKLKQLREKMRHNAIDVYVVPTCDFHGSEYIGDYFKTREFISGFTGSAGTAIITNDSARLWTDGRYFLQAEEQLEGSEYVLMCSGEPGVFTIEEYLGNLCKERAEESTLNIGFDGRTITTTLAERLEDIPGTKIDSGLDLVGDIWNDRPQLSIEPVWKLSDKYSGMSYVHKIQMIREEMCKEKADVLMITALDEVAWTLNLRGNDIAYSPVFMAFLVVTEAECILFAQKDALSSEIISSLEGVKVSDYFEVYDYIKTLRNKRIWIDKNVANYNMIRATGDNEIINKFTPALMLKAVKNDVEVENERKAHLLDGIAMTKFIYWLKNNVGRVYMTEVSLGDKLEEFRGKAESYIEPSFAPIVGYKSHGAIVHYSATKESCWEIKEEDIVLIDSGGHYLEGTTDVTRTISLGDVTDEMKSMYTAVLRGNLNLAAAVFKEGCSGVALDYLARKPLWDIGMDYNHGTGHGVGYLLNVHELPNAIRYRIMNNMQSNPSFKAGMITSDEPGVYLAGKFGIRIENLILCKEIMTSEYGRFMGFETLTLVPFDKRLIDVQKMSVEERKLLEQYNSIVYEKVAPFLSEGERAWLAAECNMQKM